MQRLINIDGIYICQTCGRMIATTRLSNTKFTIKTLFFIFSSIKKLINIS